MEEIRRRFTNAIAAKLAAAPESNAKADMIEELAENLIRRYEDMTAAGMGPDEAFAKAMDELGDVDELTDYLAGQEAERAASGGGRDSGADDFYQSVDEMARGVADMGRQLAHAAGAFFRSDGVRAAAEEGRKAAREAKDIIKNMGGVWADARVHIDMDDGAAQTGRTGKGGWSSMAIPSQGVLRLDIETARGDVDIYLDARQDAPIRVEGNLSRLEVVSAEDGTLKVRPLFTASNAFFSCRGAAGMDVSLTIPARRWESVRIVTSSGEADIGGGLDVGQLVVQTASGDVECQVKSCDLAVVKTASGDVRLEGNAAKAQVETASGDVTFDGPTGEAAISTASGDVSLSGSVWKAHVRSMSGDVQVQSMTLPAEMELSSKSGDIEASIPDNGPFKVDISSVSGTVDLRPFEKWSWSGAADPDAAVPRYILTSVSGDVSLRKY